MNYSSAYILIGIIALAAIAVIFFFFKPADRKSKISPFTYLAIGFILVGIIVGEVQWMGYSLIGTGVLVAVLDIVIKHKLKS